MQSVSSRIWTRVAMSISYNDNHYTTDTSINNDSYKLLKQFGVSANKISLIIDLSIGMLTHLELFYAYRLVICLPYIFAFFV